MLFLNSRQLCGSFSFQLQCNTAFRNLHTRISHTASTQMHCLRPCILPRSKNHWITSTEHLKLLTVLYSASGTRCCTITRLKAIRMAAAGLFCWFWLLWFTTAGETDLVQACMMVAHFMHRIVIMFFPFKLTAVKDVFSVLHKMYVLNNLHSVRKITKIYQHP